MYEASALPYDQNVGATVAVARWCHERAVTEGEEARGVDPVVAGDCNGDVLQPDVSGHRLLADDYHVTAGVARRRTPSCSRTGR